MGLYRVRFSLSVMLYGLKFLPTESNAHSTCTATHLDSDESDQFQPPVSALSDLLKEIEDLKKMVDALEKSLERERRISTLYQHTVQAQDITIFELRQSLDFHRLDPSQSSQVFLEEP